MTKNLSSWNIEVVIGPSTLCPVQLCKSWASWYQISHHIPQPQGISHDICWFSCCALIPRFPSNCVWICLWEATCTYSLQSLVFGSLMEVLPSALTTYRVLAWYPQTRPFLHLLPGIGSLSETSTEYGTDYSLWSAWYFLSSLPKLSWSMILAKYGSSAIPQSPATFLA